MEYDFAIQQVGNEDSHCIRCRVRGAIRKETQENPVKKIAEDCIKCADSDESDELGPGDRGEAA